MQIYFQIDYMRLHKTLRHLLSCMDGASIAKFDLNQIAGTNAENDKYLDGFQARPKVHYRTILALLNQVSPDDPMTPILQAQKRAQANAF
jgi:hypothetical protein